MTPSGELAIDTMQSIPQKVLNFLCSILLFRIGAARALAAKRNESPDGKVTMEFSLKAGGVPALAIEYLGKPIVLEAHLGLEPGFTNGFQLIKATENRHRGSWTNGFGERRFVPADIATPPI